MIQMLAARKVSEKRRGGEVKALAVAVRNAQNASADQFEEFLDALDGDS